ncbi:MAG: hypothetical protein DRR06_20760 [Gammaproteobacteria bacterium]|nr:MAG: hypothetical protein DRR06_20760 [Gammaproteobacteria bacterium]
MSHKKGKTRQQICAESDARRQKLLNCRAYCEGERFGTSEAGRIMKCDPKAVYHVLERMVRAGLLQSHKNGDFRQYSKPGVDWLRCSWRTVTNAEIHIQPATGPAEWR